MACFIVSEVELTPKKPEDEIPEAETNVDKAPVIPKRLQYTFKNMNTRQRENYDNTDNDSKIIVLEVIYEEKRRGVCDYMFR